ncbi:hypothetical protein B0B52_15690 [Polaromonas sp. A23]|nr:hypothetical protein B0B52_15690 [Polaromonas sp. A23]
MGLSRSVDAAGVGAEGAGAGAAGATGVAGLAGALAGAAGAAGTAACGGGVTTVVVVPSLPQPVNAAAAQTLSSQRELLGCDGFMWPPCFCTDSLVQRCTMDVHDTSPFGLSLS